MSQSSGKMCTLLKLNCCAHQDDGEDKTDPQPPEPAYKYFMLGLKDYHAGLALFLI